MFLDLVALQDLFSLFTFGDKTRTHLRVGLFASGVVSKRFFAGFGFSGVDTAVVAVDFCRVFNETVQVKITPWPPFLFDGLNRCLIDMWLACFELPNLTLKLHLHNLELSFGLISFDFHVSLEEFEMTTLILLHVY